MILFKFGVSLKGLQPEALLGLVVAEQLFSSLGEQLVVTSVSDGKHSNNSLHYKGQAFDLRIWNLHNVAAIFKALEEGLKPLGFDVILEDDHLHLEYDPKQ